MLKEIRASPPLTRGLGKTAILAVLICLSDDSSLSCRPSVVVWGAGWGEALAEIVLGDRDDCRDNLWHVTNRSRAKEADFAPTDCCKYLYSFAMHRA